MWHANNEVEPDIMLVYLGESRFIEAEVGTYIFTTLLYNYVVIYYILKIVDLSQRSLDGNILVINVINVLPERRTASVNCPVKDYRPIAYHECDICFLTSCTQQSLKNHQASHTQTIQKSPLSRAIVECDVCFKTLINVKELQQHKCDCHSSAIKAKKTKIQPVNLKQTDIVEIKKTEDEGIFKCHIWKAFSDNPVDVWTHICREHPKFAYICSEVTCVKAYVTWSGLNKHKLKHSDLDADDSLTVCCLFCEEGFKMEELCDEHMCAGKLQHKKDTENREKNGSGKGTCEDDEEVEEIKVEPNSNPKLSGNKNVETNKKKLELHQYPPEFSVVVLKSKLVCFLKTCFVYTDTFVVAYPICVTFL